MTLATANKHTISPPTYMMTWTDGCGLLNHVWRIDGLKALAENFINEGKGEFIASWQGFPFAKLPRFSPTNF